MIGLTGLGIILVIVALFYAGVHSYIAYKQTRRSMFAVQIFIFCIIGISVAFCIIFMFNELLK